MKNSVKDLTAKYHQFHLQTMNGLDDRVYKIENTEDIHLISPYHKAKKKSTRFITVKRLH